MTSLRAGEMARSRAARRSLDKQKTETKRQRRQSRAQVPDDFDLPPLPDDSEVLSFPDWCKLNNIGVRTGRRIRASGNGPVITVLSDRRIGVTKRNNRIWQAQRAR